MKAEIYQTEERISNAVKQLGRSDLSRKNFETLKQFKTELLAEGLSGHRVNSILQSFNTISHLITFELRDATRQDLMELVTEINQNNISDSKNYSVWSLCEYKKAVKRFYQWQTGRERPEIVDFVNTHPKESEKPKVDPDELLDVRMVEEMINSASNPRDKALFGLLWDTGARIGELLSLEWRDIQFKEDLMGIRIRAGKNGQRKVYVVESAPLVERWRSEYPGRACPEDPVWIALRQGGREEKRQMTYRAAASQLNRIRKETSIPELIKTNPHAWRKARATDLASKGMSQPNLNAWFGWVPGSEISKFYIRLAERDVERSIRRIYPGLDPLPEKESQFLGENIPLYDQSDLRA